MAVLTSALVALVVWVVSLMPSVRLRALVYSLPLPMTLVLATSGVAVDGSQFVGMVGLVGFFGLVAVLHQACGWPILLADLGAVAGYVAFGVAAAALPTPPAAAAVTGAVLGWAVLVAVLRPWRAHREPVRAPRQRLPRLAKLGLVFATALVITQLVGLLRGLVVTFPYSGVLVVMETRHQLSTFARQVAYQSLGLVAFLAGCYAAQRHGTVVALLVGWAAFAVTAAALNGVSALLASRRAPTPLSG